MSILKVIVEVDGNLSTCLHMPAHVFHIFLRFYCRVNVRSILVSGIVLSL